MRGAFDGRRDSPRIYRTEETDWGIQYYVEQPSGDYTLSQLGMPNIFHHTAIPILPDIVSYREFLTWWVPIDDESHYQFTLSAVRLPADKVQPYVEQRNAKFARRTFRHEDLCELILAGKLRLQDVDPEQTDIVRLQDDIAQVGQGRIWYAEQERLGRADAGVSMIRKLWARELRALVEGQPLKEWAYDPERLPISRKREMTAAASS